MTELGVEYGAVYTLEGPYDVEFNLVDDPQFNEGISFWKETDGFGLMTPSHVPYFTGRSSAGAMKLVNLEGGLDTYMWAILPVVAGKTYIVNAYVKLDEFTSGALSNRILLTDDGTAVKSVTASSAIPGWTRVTISHTVTAGKTSMTLRLYGPKGTVYWDDVWVSLADKTTRAVFNDSTDPDFVGALDAESSGLDSPDIRENAQDATEEDGGIHGDFFAGRRPITLHGTIIANGKTDRNTKVAKLKRAAKARRQDALLFWTPEGGPTVKLDLRQQQPLRVTKGFNKEFFAPMVSADARITSLEEKSVSSVVGTSLKTAKTGANKSGEGSGSLAWTNPGNITASDDVRATAVASGSIATNWLQATNFGHVLPTGAIPKAVIAKVEANRVSGTANVELLLMRMIVAGVMIENPAFWISVWNSATDTVKSFGNFNSLIATWSAAPTKAQIEASNWGVAMVANIPGVATMGVDAIQTEVFYRLPFIVENAGDEYADFTAILTGETTGPVELKNETTGDKLVVNTVMTGSDVIEIDTKNRTVKKNGSNLYGSFNFSSSDWFKLAPGHTQLMAPNNEVTINYRDAWA